MRRGRDRPQTGDGAALLREVGPKAREAATLVQALHGAAHRVATASEGVRPGPVGAAPARRRSPLAIHRGMERGEAQAETPELAALRLALNDVALARRALEPALNELLEDGDRVLDAFGARTRHLLT
jgi:hypothetical protein